MAKRYLQFAVTPAVVEAQRRSYGRAMSPEVASGRDPLGTEEMEFIADRDSFYMATVSETGWPYLQHRGGRPGFLRVVDPRTLAFADYRGNRQLLSTGNIAANDRVSLFLMDYPRRERLKILGHARVVDATPALVERLAEPEFRSVERLFFIDVVSFDWNCPKFITPRYSADEVEAVVSPLRTRIAELEAQLARAASAGHRDFPG